jgi:hypothetical protein
MKKGRRKLTTNNHQLTTILISFLVMLPVCANANYIDIYQNTTINSDLDAIVTVHDSAQITVQSNGAAIVFFLTDTSSALVYGGHASYDAQDSSILNLHGGTFGSVRYTDISAKIYVHGENFKIVPASDDHTTVFLQGNWLNGPSFDIYFRMLPQPFEQALGTNIFLVPEPTMLSFLFIGGLGLRKFNR